MNFLRETDEAKRAPRIKRLGRYSITVISASLLVSLVAVAGSLTPPGVPASTMRTLQEIYDTVVGPFDSSLITSDQDGSVIQGLKYISENLFWAASTSNNIYNSNIGNVGIGTNNPETKFELVGTASVSAITGSVFTGVSNCDLESQTLNWDSSTGRFSCLTDGGGGSVSSNSLDFDEFENALNLDANTTITGGAFALTFDHASASGNFEVSGRASASQTFGSGLTDCDLESQTLNWDSSTGRFSCLADAGAGGLAFNGIEVRESDGTFSHVGSVSFDAGHFAITNTASESYVRLDWGPGGPASLSQNETVTGTWTFTNGASFSGPFEFSNGASFSSITLNGTSVTSFRPASNSLDWDEFTNAMTLDASTTTALNGNTLTFGGLSLVGTNASVSGNFEVAGYASASQTFGSGLTDCDLESETLNWDATTGRFSCLTDSGFGGLAFNGIEVRESDGAFSHVGSVSFDAGHFTITNTASESYVRLDWGPGGPASLSQNETVTGTWTFNNASVSGGFEIAGSLFVNGAISNQTGPLNFADSASISGNFGPSIDNTYDLGSTALRWKSINVGPGSFNLTSTTGTSGAGANYTLGQITFGSGSSLSFGTSAVGTGSVGTLALQTAGTPRLYVGQTGNIGIGTTSPASLFNVNGGHFTLSPFSGGATGEMRFQELTSNGTNYSAFKASVSLAGNTVWTLPAADGTSGQVFQTNGAGQLSFMTAMSNPMTLAGDLIYGSTTASVSTPARLGIGANGQCLVVTAGFPSWQNCAADPISTPAGADTQVQFNNGGVFGADPAFTWSNGTGVKQLTLSTSKVGEYMPLILRNTSADATSTTEFYVGNDAAADTLAFVVNSSAFTGAANQASITNRQAGNLTFGTNNTERVRIDSAGNVGVGTTVPGALFAVGPTSQFKVSSTGLVTATGGLTITGSVSLNNSANFPINIGTGTTNAAITIGGGSNTVQINSSNWDVSAGGVITSLGGLSVTGDTTLNSSGIGVTNIHTGTSSGALNLGTGSSTSPVSIGGGTNTLAIDTSIWDLTSAGALSGLTGITSAGGIVNLNANSNFAVNIGTGSSLGAVSIGATGNTVTIESSNWDVSAAGAASGFSSITSQGLITANGGLTIASGAFNVLVNSSTGAAINIGTGSSNNPITIGGNSNTVVIDSSNWDVSAAGAASLVTITSSGLITGNGGLTVASGSINLLVNSTTGAVINVGTGTSTSPVTVGGGTNTVAINSSNWDVSAAGSASFPTITSSGLITANGGLTIASGAFNVLVNSTTGAAINVGTGTSTSPVTIGGGTNTVAINSSNWDVSAAGAMSGLTGVTSSGLVTSSGGLTVTDSAINFNVNSATANAINIGTGTSNSPVTIGGGTNTVAINSSNWDVSAAGAASGFTSITSSGLITGNGGLTIASGSINLLVNSGVANALNIGTGTSISPVTIGGNSNTVAIDSNAWDISALGVVTGLTGITNTGTLTSTGGTINLNASTSFAINIGTDSSTTGVITIGGNANTLAIDTSDWDVTTAGAMTGISGIANNGAYTQSGSDINSFTGNVGIGTTVPASLFNVSGGHITFGPFSAGSGNTGQLRFQELNVNGPEYVGFKAPDTITASTIWTLPSADGTNGQILMTNGAGILSWTASSSASFGMSNPMTTIGDTIYGSTTASISTPARLAIGTVGQCLVVSGGLPSWGSCAGTATAAGSNGQVQFNNSGAFGADGAFTWDNTDKTLSIAQSIAANSTYVPLVLRNTNAGSARATQLQIGNDVASASLTLTMNTSTTTGRNNFADIWNQLAGALTFGTNALERVRIDSAGNVGIGTTTTSAALMSIAQPVITSGSPKILQVTGGTNTTLTTLAEAIDVDFNLSHTVQFATGDKVTQRAMLTQAPTYTFVGASTITSATTAEVSGGPRAGTNATLTNSYALRVAGGPVSGAGTVTNAYGLRVDLPTGATNNYVAVFGATGGNVGIGTTAPTEVLDIGGSSAAINFSGGSHHQIKTVAGQNLSLMPGGNVGIGTATPQAFLAVGTTGQFQVSSAGAVTAVGVNADGGLLQGALGLTITGAATNLNASSNFATNINTGSSTGALSLGGGSATVAVNSSAWDISTAGAITGVTTLDTSGRITTTGGITSTGAITNLNASSDFATNINTGTSTGALSLGGGSGTVAVNSSVWDISTAGAVTGVTTLGTSGLITSAGGITSTVGAVSLTTTGGSLINIGTGTQTGAVSLGGGLNDVIVNSDTWDVSAGGAITGVTTLNTTSLITSAGGITNTAGNVNLNVDSGFVTNIQTGTATGAVTLGGGSNDVIINSDTWDVSAGGVITGATLNTTSLITGTGGLTISGGTVNINSAGFLLNIGTTSQTGAMTIGGNTSTLAIDTSDWDISTAGAMTGISGITNDGAYTQTGATANTFTGTTTFSNGTFSALFTGGNLGIGTTTPTSILAFGGDVARTIQLEARTTNAAGSAFSVVAGAAGTGATGFAGGQLNLTGGAAAGSTGAAAGGDVRIIGGAGVNGGATGNVILVATAGNAGIGTTAPGSKLQVNGNTALGYSTSTVGPANGLAVSGNVGIGTITPVTALNVVGGHITLSPFAVGAGNTGQFRFQELAANGTEYVGFKAPDAIASPSLIWTLPSADGTVGQVLQTSGTGTLSWTANAAASASMANPMTLTGDIIYGSTTGAPSTPARLGIGSTGQCLVVAGGLPAWGSCVGTASAAGSPGQVQFNSAGLLGADSAFSWDNDATDKTLTLNLTKAGVYIPLALRNPSAGSASSTELRVGNNSAADTLALTVNSSAFTGRNNFVDIWNRQAGAMTFGTNNLERVRIDSAGNVGIGTTTTSAALLAVGTTSQFRVTSAGLITGAGLTITDGATAISLGGGSNTVSVNSSTWDITSAGVASGFTGITSANGNISLNATSGTSTTAIGTGTTSGAITIGGGSNPLTINTEAWDVSATGAASGFTTLTTSALITSGGGITSTGGPVNIHSGANTINIGVDGGQTGTVTIGSGDPVVINSNTWDVSSTGNASGFTSLSTVGLLTSAGGITNTDGAVDIHSGPNTIEIGVDGLQTGAVIIGSGDVVNIDSSTWDVLAGAASGFTTLSTTGAITSAGGLNNTAGPVDIRSGANTIEIGVDGGQTGAVIIGSGDVVNIDSSTWSVTAGAASGFTTLSTTGLITSAGGISNTTGQVDINSGPNSLNIATSGTQTGAVTIGSGDVVNINSSTWDVLAGAASGFTTLSTTGLITSDGGISNTTGQVDINSGPNSLNIATSGTQTGTVTIGSGDGVTVNSSTWDISTAGAVSGVTSFTASGLITGTGGITLDTGAVNINSGGNALNIGTGTQTGTITISAGDPVVINSSDWDVSATGVMTGISGITNDGAYTQTGATANTFTGATTFTATATFSNATAAIFNPGNVGIGTTAPGSKLEVSTATNTNAIEIRNSSLGTRGSWLFYPVTNGTNTDMRLGEYQAGVFTDRITFQAGGNVGIGTTSPAAKLAVAGNLLFTAASPTISPSTTNTSLSIDSNGTGALNLNNTATGDIVMAGGVGATGCTLTNSTGAFSCAGNITTTAAGTPTAGFWIRNTASGFLYPSTITDSIGIGDTTPDSRFTVGTTSQFQVNSSGRVLADVGLGDAGSLSYSFVGDTDTGSYRSATDEMRFMTAGIDRVTINSGGNVGVGDTTPAALFTVGTTDAFQVNTSGRVLANVGASGAGNLAYSFVTDTDLGLYRSAADEMRFQTAGTDKVTITSAGNVGIGTTSSAYKLRVEGVIYASTQGTAVNEVLTAGRAVNTGAGLTGGGDLTTDRTISIPTDGVTNAMLVNSTFTVNAGSGMSGGGTAELGTSLTLSSSWTASSGGNIFNNNSGNVGIGEDTPGSKLQVNGNTALGYSGPTAGPANGLTVSGNVGIGTIAPTEKLEVVGNVLVSGNITTVTGTITANTLVGSCNIDISISGTTSTESGPGDPHTHTFSDTGSDGECADYAEVYHSSEPVNPGDLVAFDPMDPDPGHVKKATISNAHNMMGIVSTSPAALIGNNHFVSGLMASQYHNTDEPAVALVGRVPLKVSLENGPISMGDHLTVSSVPGVAMKATEAGMTVGVAMWTPETNASGDTTVLTFVNVGYWAPDVASLGDGTLAGIEPGVIAQIMNSVRDLIANGTLTLVKSVRGVFDTVEVKNGVTTYDRVTGEPYCIGVENGQTVTTRGSCEDQVVPTPTPSPTDSSGSGATPSPSTTPSGTPAEDADTDTDPTAQGGEPLTGASSNGGPEETQSPSDESTSEETSASETESESSSESGTESSTEATSDSNSETSSNP